MNALFINDTRRSSAFETSDCSDEPKNRWKSSSTAPKAGSTEAHIWKQELGFVRLLFQVKVANLRAIIPFDLPQIAALDALDSTNLWI